MNIDKVVSCLKELDESCAIKLSSEVVGSVEIHNIEVGNFSAEIQVEGSYVAILTRHYKGFASFDFSEGTADSTAFVLDKILNSIKENKIDLAA